MSKLLPPDSSLANAVNLYPNHYVVESFGDDEFPTCEGFQLCAVPTPLAHREKFFSVQNSRN